MRSDVAVVTGACGGDVKHAETATPAPSGSASAPPSASSPEATASSTPQAPPAAPAPKGKFQSFAVGATSGKVDKVGNKDGALTPDGVKDLVFEAELEGPAVAIGLISTDAAGTQNGAFSADTYVGDQALPAEANADVTQGKASSGLAAYESNKLLNAKGGSLAALSDGKHKLVLHISSKDAPKGVHKAFAVCDNKTLTWSPTASAR